MQMLGPYCQCELLKAGLLFQEHLTLRQSCSKILPGLEGHLHITSGFVPLGFQLYWEK